MNTERVASFTGRLLQLEEELQTLIDTYHPDEAAIEKLFFYKNVKTAIDVGQARGVIMLTLARNHLIPQEFTPQQVKIAVSGYGKADKQQVQRMVQLLLALPAIPKPDDVADALAVAMAAIGNTARTRRTPHHGH